MLKVEILTTHCEGRKTGDTMSYQLKLTITTEPPVVFVSRPVVSAELVLQAHDRIMKTVRREMEWIDTLGRP